MSCKKLIFLIFIVILQGCTKIEEASIIDGYWGDFLPGRVYVLEMDVFLINKTPSQGKAVGSLTPPGNIFQEAGLYEAPQDINTYLSSKEKFIYVNRVISKKSELSIVSVELTTGWNLMVGSYCHLTVYARMGKTNELVDITDLTIRIIDQEHCAGIPFSDRRLLKARV